jgi:transcriptional regulator GlxA family with amidase domain
MYRILILALDGVMDSSLALTLDTIATANRLAGLRGPPDPLSSTVFHPGRRRIRTGVGLTLAVKPAVRVPHYDALVVPGLGLATESDLDRFFASRATRPVLEWLRRNGGRFPLVAASCSAVFLIAEAGLLANRTATTTWWLGAAFRARHPDVELDESRMVVESDGVVCAGAALAQIDLMLHLIARATSPDLSREVSRYLAIDERPSQARYMMLSAVAGLGQEVGAIERWIRANRARAFSIGEMASALGMSPRTLDRRIRAATGSGASRFIQRLRLEHAAHRIETTNLAMSEIAEEVGYQDASTLRRLLRRHLDVNPTDLRRRAS